MLADNEKEFEDLQSLNDKLQLENDELRRKKKIIRFEYENLFYENGSHYIGGVW